MEASKYQLKILDWLESGRGNATCNAVAGSGKTTTLKLAAEKLQQMGVDPQSVRVIVFGKQNSLDLIAKFGRDWKEAISTLHSLGFRILQQEIGRFRANEKIITNKYKKIAADFQFIPTGRGRKAAKGSLITREAISKVDSFLTLVDLARLTLSDLSANSLQSLVLHHHLDGIHDFKAVSQAIADISVEGQERALNQHCIDYTDMIWLPVEWGLNHRKWFKTYEWVLVDECQDLNAAQLELSLMLAQENGRMLYVGDPKQAIFGFAGADNQSYSKILQRTKATELPLSLCYRCPQQHIELVNRIYPDIPIEAKPDAAAGTLETITNEDLWSEDSPAHLRIGDMVLSRKTAPLVSLCIRLIARGIAATVKGRDIGKQIKYELETISEIRGFKYSEFPKFVQEYREFKFNAYENLDNAEQLKENLADKLEALKTIYTSQPNARSIADLENYIDDLFSDEESPITLSTCHRAKGLEGDRIFIIKPEDLPMSWGGQLKWQKEQEDNLLYVALTRSKSELYIVGYPDWLKSEQPSPADEVKDVESALSPSNEATARSVAPESIAINLPESETSSVNSLQGLETAIASLTFEQRCQLLNSLTETVTQEKWDRTFKLLSFDANRSDRAIASLAGVSAPFVGKVRATAIEQGDRKEDYRIDKRGRKSFTRG